MKTLRATQMMASVLVLTVALMLGVQRQARAGDTARVLAAIAAGVILYEALDDDDGGRKHKCTRQCKHKQNRRQNQRYRDNRQDAYYRPATRPIGYNTPLPRQCNDDRYYGNNRNDSYYGDSGYGRQQSRYQRPSRYADVQVRNGRRGTSVDFQYRDSRHR